MVYPYTKRWTWLCHLVLGVAIGLGPVGAWVAVTGTTPPEALLLGAAVAFWIAGFDVIYAFMDVTVDREQGLHSIPADLGDARRPLEHPGCCTYWRWRCWRSPGSSRERTSSTISGWVCARLLLAYENWLMRKADLEKSGRGLHDYERDDKRGLSILHHPKSLCAVSDGRDSIPGCGARAPAECGATPRPNRAR